MSSTSYDKLREIEMFHKKKMRYKRIMQKRRRRTFTIIAIALIVSSFLIYTKISQDRYSAFLMNNSKYGKVNNSLLAENIDDLTKKLNINEVDYKWSENIIENNKPNKIVIHHAVTTGAKPEEINSWHIERGYGGIGYHYYIKKDGTIYRGRDEKMQGAHALGENSSSIGICLEGSYDKEKLEEVQMNSLINLSASLVVKYNMENIIGHRDCNDTLCPGQNVNIDKVKDNVIKVMTNSIE